MKYEKAYAEVVMLDNSDVITASDLGGGFGCNTKASLTDPKPCHNPNQFSVTGLSNSEDDFWG